MKMMTLTIRNRAAALVFSILILGAGVMFFTLGMALLAALAVGGSVIGAGVAAYRLLRGRSHQQRTQRLSHSSSLDPSLEIQPVDAAVIRAPAEPDK